MRGEVLHDSAVADPDADGARGEAGLALAKSLRTPLYHQIYLILRQQIVDHIYGFDQRIPSEQELGRRYEVSRITARRAVQELAAEGYVIRQRGRGTRVRYRGPATQVRSSVEGLFEDLLAMGLETEVELLEFAYIPASAEVAVALDCPPGRMMQRAVRVRHLDSRPFSHLTTWVPEQIGRKFEAGDLQRQPLLVLLERSGVLVDSATQTISAALADAGMASRLEVSVGSALLKISRVVRARGGRPVEYITGLYRPDRYQYQMVLSRVRDKGHNIWSTGGAPTRPESS